MKDEHEQLFSEYVTEMRESKRKADAWWADLQAKSTDESDRFGPKKLWPLKSASHPWVIATFRKYYFLCDELNKRMAAEAVENASKSSTVSEEERWGKDEVDDDDDGEVDPRFFAYEFFATAKTQDLYEYLQSLAYVPIGLKNGKAV